jgi:hypothetical protein
MLRRVRKERGWADDVDLGASVLTLIGGFDFSVEQVRHELHAVADREDRHVELEDFARAVRRRL